MIKKTVVMKLREESVQIHALTYPIVQMAIGEGALYLMQVRELLGILVALFGWK